MQDPSSFDLPRQRLRITYAKEEAIKFISHHDEFRLWERALRRADLPLLYKQGFNPQPHIQFASPLGVGMTGAREWVDVVLSPPLPLEEVTTRLGASLPPAVTLVTLEEVDFKAPALQGLLIGADYSIVIYATPEELAPDALQVRVADFLAEAEIWRERERKGERYTYNLRPLVYLLRYDGYDPDAEAHRLFVRVQQRAGATGRPDEVVDALGLDDQARTLCRERLYREDFPNDLAIFAHYPVISQEEIAGPAGSGQAAQRGRAALATARPVGRSLSERAGDEFD